VWRRAQSTGLLTKPIQRDLARFRATVLREPASLAYDIRRRWGVGGNSSVYRFGLDLPLFLGRDPFFHGSTSHHLSVSGSEAAHRFTDISGNSLPFEKSRSSVTATLAGLPSPAGNLASLQRSNIKFSGPEDRSISTLLQPIYERSALPNTGARGEFGTVRNEFSSVPGASARGGADRGGEVRTGAQDLPIATAQPRNYEAGSIPRSYLQPTTVLAELRERTISRTALSKPSSSGSTTERTALTTNRDVTISTVKGKLAPQRSRVGGETTLPLSSDQPRTGMIDSPVVKTLADAARVKIAPSTDLRLTKPAVPQITPTISRSFASGAHERPGLPALSNERGIGNFAGGYAAPVFTARKTAMTSGLSAMPLSIAPMFKRDPSASRTSSRGGAEDLQTDGIFDIIPANARESGGEAGIQQIQRSLDSRLRGNDEFGLPTSPTNFSSRTLAIGRSASGAGTEITFDSSDSTRTSGITSPAQSHDGKLPVTNVHDLLRAETSIFRSAAEAGFGTIRHSGPEGSLQGWLPLHQSGLSSGNVYRAGSLIQRAAGPLAQPLSVVSLANIRTAMGDQLPGVTTPSQAIQSTETFSSTRIPAVTSVRSSEIHLQTAGLTPVLAPVRRVKITRFPLMRRSDVPPRQELHAPVPEMRGTAYEMPVAALAVMRDERSLTALHRSNGTSLQTAPQETSSAANRVVPIEVSAETGRVESPATAAKPQIDLDELVEKAWHKLMRKLTIEHERRGYARWRS
jgi:hypothetical protein